MTTPFHLEVFSSGMKAKLDVKCRRIEGQNAEIAKSRRDFSLSNQAEALPFTQKTRGYGTYVWRNNS